LLFALVAVLGPLIAPYGASQRVSADARQAPSLAHLFGADHLGRDVFSRVVVGARSILTLAGLGTLLAVGLGTFFGLLSGYRGGLFDEALMRSFDGLLAIPALLLALLLLGTLGRSSSSVLLVIAVVYTPIVARVVRSETLKLKAKGFVEAARLRGESTAFILGREILPSVLPALSVEASLRFSYAIFLVASLGFLGVGVQPPTPDWGLMVSEARTFVGLTPWALAFPALAISLLVVGVNLLADGLKTALQSGSTVVPINPKRVVRPPQPTTTDTNRPAQDVPALEIDNLSVHYEQRGERLHAVRQVSLRVEPGQVYALVGESGSGKSSLALALVRCLSPNGAVSQGRIVLGGRDLLALDADALRRVWGQQLGLIPQDPLASLNPSLRIGAQLVEGVNQHARLNATEAHERAVAWLKTVKIADPRRVANSYPHELSGGMQQRVMIAMALSTHPQFLVLDEPTTGLDVTTEAVILDLVRGLIRAQHTAALYISHDLGVVAGIAERVAVLYAGEVVEDGATDELYQRPLHPYTRGLLDSVPRVGRGKAQAALTSMRGQIPALSALPSGCVFAPRCPLAVARCHDERPELETLPFGHDRRVRCHRWAEVVAGNIDAQQRSRSVTPNATAAPEEHPLLAINNLTTHFRLRRSALEFFRGKPRNVVKAVDGVSLTLKAGETLGLVGESGSGKTSLARTLLGLEQATRGSVTLWGRALPNKLARRTRATLRHLQLVSQHPEEALNPYMSVAQSLKRPLRRLLQRSRSQAKRDVARLLEQVGLDARYARRLPAQLSGGEKQRVAIARAFAAQPALVVCDEPTSALDVSVQAHILNLLNRLQRQHGGAYVFISHDLAAVGYLADQVAVLYLGQLVEQGSASLFFDPPHHPYTEALLSAIPSLEPQTLATPIRLEGEPPSPTNAPAGCPFHPRCPRFLGALCAQERPPWQVEGAHRVRCHLPLETLRREQRAAGIPEREGGT